MISWGLVTISCGVVMVSWLFGNGKLRCGNGKLECGNGKLRCGYKGMGVW
ncbi:hypothetical protein [Alistipes sp. ZOR0009]|jgi:hypothetical protein|nr:hypothetical protein [Alistipes sp. ZOR0009]